MNTRFIDNYLLYLLARASHQASRQFHKQVKDAGLQVPEWRVLAALSDGDGGSVGDLAQITLLQQPTLTKLLDRMVRQGLVERRADSDDGRKVRIHITVRGRQLSADLLRRAKRHEAEVLSGYTPEAAEALKTALRTLIERT